MYHNELNNVLSSTETLKKHLNEKIEADKRYLATYGCDDAIIIPDGDYLVTLPGSNDLFIKMERNSKGNLVLPAGKINAVDMHSATTLTKQSAQIMADFINEEADRHPDNVSRVIKMRDAAQDRLDSYTELLATL